MDVAVIGAGPVGLTLAGNLAAAGVVTANFERRTGVRDPNETRSFAIHARLLEQGEASGVTEQILADGAMRRGIQLYGNDRTKGVFVDFSHLPTEYGLLVIPQPLVEKALARRAAEAGLDLSYDSRLVALKPEGNGVVFQTEDHNHVRTEHWARYLVGADGARSKVREAIGQTFKNPKGFLRSMMLADVTVDSPLPSDTVTASGARGHFAFITPYDNSENPGRYRVMAWSGVQNEKQIEDPVDLEDLQEITTRVFGRNLGINAINWSRRFHATEAAVSSYQGESPLDHILLAGDAAHIHSPAGGQGLNLGSGDAHNLSWRLASVVNHGADPHVLLPEYTRERLPVAQEVIASSHLILELAVTRSRILQRLRVPLLNTALRVPQIRDKVAGQLSAIGVNYHQRGDGHPLVGARIDPKIVTAGRTHGEMRASEGRFTYVHRPGTPLPNISGFEKRVNVVQGSGTLPSILVRPDGYGAWAYEGGKGVDPERVTSSLRIALQKLCGQPTVAA